MHICTRTCVHVCAYIYIYVVYDYMVVMRMFLGLESYPRLPRASSKALGPCVNKLGIGRLLRAWSFLPAGIVTMLG